MSTSNEKEIDETPKNGTDGNENGGGGGDDDDTAEESILPPVTPAILEEYRREVAMKEEAEEEGGRRRRKHKSPLDVCGIPSCLMLVLVALIILVIVGTVLAVVLYTEDKFEEVLPPSDAPSIMATATIEPSQR